MKAFAFLAALLLCAILRASLADEPPIVFSRSGCKAVVSVGDGVGGGIRSVALTAFGQQWEKLLTVRHGAAELLAPEVRVPSVLRLVPPDRRETVLAELVVYPNRSVSWQAELQLASAAAPRWFDGWSEAVGLPVKKFKTLQAVDASDWPAWGKPALLVLGRNACGGGLRDTFRLAVGRKINLLVLDADWFGKRVVAEREFAVTPKQMAGVLADRQTERWPLPPVFSRQDLPWPGVANRETWIASAAYPLVEEVRCANGNATALRLVLSYLPWQNQLGRCEMADELFLRVLAESAKGAAGRQPLGARWRLLYPAAKDVHADKRPVLTSAIHAAVAAPDGEHTTAAAQDDAIRAYVLDLRGSDALLDDLFEQTALKNIETRVGTATPLLILGDHPLLVEWKWLKLDRGHHRSQQPGVLWWPDRMLPPSPEDQLHLMQQFTDWNVLLGEVPKGEMR
jgi:hypothetical protein